MGIGEINYDDLMHNKDKTAYYKVGYILLPFFAVAVVVLASNLLIGMKNAFLLHFLPCIFLSIK